MKKGIILVLALVGFIVNGAMAQSKFGHINTSEMIALMPEMVNVKNKLDTFQIGLKAEYDNEMKKYQELMMEYEKMLADSVSPTFLKSKEDEIVQKQQKIQELPTLLENEYAEKQGKLMKPLVDKLQAAIKDVAKEKGLTYVFDLSLGALLQYDPADDISKDVRKKLGISDTATPIKFQ